MKATVSILMVDDDEEDFLIVRDLLSQLRDKRFAIEWAPDFKTGLQQMLNCAYEVYLVDYRLGPENGLDLIRQSVRGGCDGPFILLTGMDDETLDEEAEAAGVADFLVKGDFNAQELARSLRYAVAHARDLAEIKSLNAGLEKRVAERTQELENAKRALEIALSQERELNEMKSRFVTMASHEFRTPLTVIKTSASLIDAYADRQDPDKIKKHAGRIENTVDNLNNILKEFLSLGRLDEGQVQAKPSEANLREIVEDVEAEMQYIFKQGQYIDYLHEGAEEVVLDAGLLKNILINLVSNAIKYSSEGARICLRTRVLDGHTTILVQDEGIGMSPEDQQKLFSRFFRADNVGNIPGTGLGLHIVKRYVDLLKGDIRCESRLGQGTTFRVEFGNGEVRGED